MVLPLTIASHLGSSPRIAAGATLVPLMKSLQIHSLMAARLYADMLLYRHIETAQDYQKLQNGKFHSGMDICKPPPLECKQVQIHAHI